MPKRPRTQVTEEQLCENEKLYFENKDPMIAHPGFCDDVPPKTEFMKTVTWRVSKCSEIDRQQGVPKSACGTSARRSGERWHAHKAMGLKQGRAFR